MAAWYIIFNGEQVGPVELRELSKYNLTPDSMVWTEGMPDWRPAAEVPEVAGLLYGAGTYGQQPPYPNGYRRGYNEGFREGYYEGGHPSGKSKVAAGVLAILLGGLGIQYFYLGKVAGGFITILLTIITCGLWEVLTLVQGIIMLTMSDPEFDRKFVYTDKTLPLF